MDESHNVEQYHVELGDADGGGVFEKVSRRSLPVAMVYLAIPVTAVTAEVERQRLQSEARVVKRVLATCASTVAREISLNQMADKDSQYRLDGTRPFEMYSNGMRNVARATAMIAFLDPASHGVGMKLNVATGCGCPLVLLHRSSSSGGPFVRLNASAAPAALGSISWMIRGLSLSWMPWVILYRDADDLLIKFSEFWRLHGDSLLENGQEIIAGRRRFWKPARHGLVRRRRVLGLRREDLAKIVECHPSLLQALEEEKLVFSALPFDRLRRILYPLCLQVEQPNEPGREELYLGLRMEQRPPFGDVEYDFLKLSHNALRKAGKIHRCKDPGCQLRGWWDSGWDEAWFEAWDTLGLGRTIWAGENWCPFEDESDAQQLILPGLEALGEELELVELEHSKSNIHLLPTTPEEWIRRVSCDHKGGRGTP